MYVLLEYLLSLAAVSLLGLILFGVAVVGVVAKDGADRLAAKTAEHLPKIAAHMSPRHLAAIRKNHNGPLAQS